MVLVYIITVMTLTPIAARAPEFRFQTWAALPRFMAMRAVPVAGADDLPPLPPVGHSKAKWSKRPRLKQHRPLFLPLPPPLELRGKTGEEGLPLLSPLVYSKVPTILPRKKPRAMCILFSLSRLCFLVISKAWYSATASASASSI